MKDVLIFSFDMVLGKFLGAWAFYSILLALTLVYQVILLILTNWQPRPEVINVNDLKAHVDYGVLIGSYMGIWLYGGATIAIGILFSALTENQIIAGFLSMTVLLFLWVGDIAGIVPASIISTNVVEALRVISLQAHYSTSFMRGVIVFEDVYFFAALIFVSLFITTRLVESRRWR